jgi:hypothetical protein
MGYVFNFLSGRAKARGFLDLANEYLVTSQNSANMGYSGPAIDNLFRATELISKAELILHRLTEAESKTHGSIARAINRWSKDGNMDAAFASLYNQLGQARPKARYGSSSQRPSPPDSEDVDLVRTTLESVRKKCARSTDD